MNEWKAETMKDQTHTPGPWQVAEYGQNRELPAFRLIRRGPATIAMITAQCEMDGGKDHIKIDETTAANARLIAAAPDLLEALEGLLEAGAQLPQNATHEGLTNCALMARARAAIAKAKVARA